MSEVSITVKAGAGLARGVGPEHNIAALVQTFKRLLTCVYSTTS